eukprot:g4219.t1
MKWTLFLFFVLLVTVESKPRRGLLARKACANALKLKSPECLNGGTLHARNTSSLDSCAYCDCRGSWRGIDCGLCSSKSTCPVKEGRRSIGCTSSSISPTEYETSVGKQLSCYCGGPDGITKYLCQQQPNTNWQISISSTKTEGKFELEITERAGMPSQDAQPSCAGYDPKKCPSKERYRYATPLVWTGKMQNCVWKTGKCISPLKGDDCVIYSCNDAKIECPPSVVKKCPGWSKFGCDSPPGEDPPYWMHQCRPMMYPLDGYGITITCYKKRVDGKYQCYLSQEYSFLATIGMKCETGTCIYPKTLKTVV